MIDNSEQSPAHRDRPATSSALRRLVASPLLHFFILGGVIFWIYGVMNDAPSATQVDTIVLSEPEADLLVQRFVATWKRKPTHSELQGLMDDWAKEAALVREARALGLDRSDEVIRARLAQKLRFLVESQAAGLVPDDAQLTAFMKAHPERFKSPDLIAFETVKLPDDTPDEVDRIRTALEGGEDPATLGAATLLPAAMALSDQRRIDQTFGAGFAEQLAALPDNAWQGPIKTGFGDLFVRVTARQPARLPALDEVRERVTYDWRATQATEMRDGFVAAAVGRYRVELPKPEAILGK